MKAIADFHLHGKYSRAVSRQMVVGEIARWARIKGIDLVAAPDWTHPLFFKELRNDLVEVASGVFACRKDRNGPGFILVTEISSIYSQGGRGRRIHNLVMAPSFKVVERINASLRSQGANLLSDGRPIVKLSARELVELVMEADKNCLVIPAHVWTPWFSLYGSRSGFDSLDECYGRFGRYIYGIETGLSSDPAMNWRLAELDKRSIVSFSDAHSPAKIGREATVFQVKKQKVKSKKDSLKVRINYADIIGAIKQDNESDWEIGHTIEFYPEEGKYHYTGHRKCGVVHSPEQTQKLGRTCPVCGKELTIGVMHRVEELASRSEGEVAGDLVKIGSHLEAQKWRHRPAFVMMVPLAEVIAESLGMGVNSQAVQKQYDRLTGQLLSEFNVLVKAELSDIRKIAGERVAEALGRVRRGDLVIDPGFDGVFGRVNIWPTEDTELKNMFKQGQISLF